MEHIEYAQTRGLSEAEVQERLETTQTGVLALASEAESYAIPLSHFYDGQSLYLRLGISPGSTKASFLESTKKATYLLYAAEPTNAAQGIDSWSVLLTGSLEEIPVADYERFDTAEINARFAPIRVFGEVIDEIEIKIYEFKIESKAGRATLEVQ